MNAAKEMNFEAGQRVYSDRGDAAEYVSRYEDGHVVRPFVEVGGNYDEPGYEDVGKPQLWSKVFPSAPVAKYNDELKALHAKIADAEQRLRDLREEDRQYQAEVTKRAAERKAEYARHEMLQPLDDLLAGRITHFAVFSGYNHDKFSVETFAQVMENKDRYSRDKLRLLSLHGDPKEKTFKWTCHQYRHDSYTSEYLVPCSSEEAAHAVVREYVAHRLEAVAKSLDGNCVTWARIGVEWGVPVPAAVVAKAAEVQAADDSAREERVKAEYEKAVNALRKQGLDIYAVPFADAGRPA